MRVLLVVAALVVGLMGAQAVAAEKEIAAIEAVLKPGPLDIGLFSTGFLKAVPPAQLSQVTEQIKALIGPVVAVTPKSGQSYLVETATHEMPTDIALDADGKIAGLFFRTPVAKNESIEDLLKQIAGAAPEVAYLVTKNGEVVYSGNADKALAVGSAFKLGVLKALRDEIDAGARKWSDVVILADADISLPTGMLQGWPAGSPLTLHTLAALMISISDNTATDTLMHAIGRDKVEAVLGLKPVLTTRELFALKADPVLKAQYQAGDEAAKRTVLEAIGKGGLPDITKVSTPHDAGVEWDLTPSKLCELIGAVGDLDVTQINPGVANKADWAKVSFKGGSEIGVLSVTTRMTAKDGSVYCASAIWNGPAALDESKAEAAYAGLVHRLAQR
jgi:beta-lactamase class A